MSFQHLPSLSQPEDQNNSNYQEWTVNTDNTMNYYDLSLAETCLEVSRKEKKHNVEQVEGNKEQWDVCIAHYTKNVDRLG